MSTKFSFLRLIIFCNIFYVCQIKAQRSFTLKQCIEYGLESNPASKVYQNEKKMADAKAKELLSGYLPNLSFSGTIDDNLKVQEQVIPAGLFGDEDIRVAFTKQFNTNGTLQLNQTIYDQSLITGLKARQLGKEQADLNKKKSDETIIYNISTAYYQIFTYREQLELLKINLETYHKQLEITDLKVKKGVTLQNDADKVKVNYNNTLSQIRVAETNIALAKNQLKYEMGFPMQDPLEIEVIKIEDGGLSTDLAGNFQFDNIIDFKLDKINADLLKIDEKQIRAGGLPVLTAYARYGWNGFGDNLWQSFESLQSFSSIGLKLTVPIFEGFKRRSQYQQASYKYDNALENNKLNAGKYQLDYENSVSKLYKSESTLENDKRNMELSRSIFNVTDLQYQKGIIDMNDWLDAQNSLKTSQNSYLSSLYNFLQSKIDLKKAQGTLQQFYKSL